MLFTVGVSTGTGRHWHLPLPCRAPARTQAHHAEIKAKRQSELARFSHVLPPGVVPGVHAGRAVTSLQAACKLCCGARFPWLHKPELLLQAQTPGAATFATAVRHLLKWQTIECLQLTMLALNTVPISHILPISMGSTLPMFQRACLNGRYWPCQREGGAVTLHARCSFASLGCKHWGRHMQAKMALQGSWCNPQHD